MSKKIDTDTVPTKLGTLYPPPHHTATRDRIKKALGDQAGLTQFGVNLTVLPPDCSSALPHWHEKEDEFVYIISGHPTLVYGATEERLAPGDCAGFKAGEEIDHCLRNDTGCDVVLLEIGSRKDGERAFYPGLDLMIDTAKADLYFHLDGTPYPDLRRRGPGED
ncbi:cupin domain-containing protein [Celeribacter halophilus]|uniref:cupin domain-containing protein n=1 Tax=Celeribacter halophilus TaxID=576117 RepID=UPI003A8DF12E